MTDSARTGLVCTSDYVNELTIQDLHCLVTLVSNFHACSRVSYVSSKSKLHEQIKPVFTDPVMFILAPSGSYQPCCPCEGSSVLLAPEKLKVTFPEISFFS